MSAAIAAAAVPAALSASEPSTETGTESIADVETVRDIFQECEMRLPASFEVGDVVRVSGFTGPNSAFNGSTWRVASREWPSGVATLVRV
jgi:hypothetical protein